MTVNTADAQTLKNALRSDVKTWHNITCSTMDEVVNYINLEPAQGPGEAVFSFRPDGLIELLYYL